MRVIQPCLPSDADLPSYHATGVHDVDTGLVDAADILSPDQNLISASELLNLPSHGQHANVIYKTQDNYSLWQLE